MKAYDTFDREIEIGDEVLFNYSSTGGALTNGIVVGYCNIFGNAGIEITFIDKSWREGSKRRVKASNTYIIKKAEVTK